MKKINYLTIVSILGISSLLLSSCGGSKTLVIPHAVSTASAIKVSDLGLTKGQYEILKTITETATVTCEYKNDGIKITGDDFFIKFKYNQKKGWSIDSFSGAASMGYFSTDIEAVENRVPSPEEFSRRVAMARIIQAATDLNADGIIEPITTTRTDGIGKNKIEFTSTVRAKLITLKTK